jgi:hypothetical protein
MKMPGAVDGAYVRARRVLLDALEALTDHLDAVILVGAQAIYLHVGEGDLNVAPYTTDGDLALDRDVLADDPTLRSLMESAGFLLAESNVGSWVSPDGVPIDLMVPEIQGGPGRRGARLGPHGNTVARKAKGLEAALVDRVPLTISALDPADNRQVTIAVAGPTALLVAKLHKLYERRNDLNRLDNKDALDVYRLLQAVPTETLAATITTLLLDGRSREVTQLGISYLRDLFSAPDAPGSRMAGTAVESLDDPERIATSCAYLTEDLLAAVSHHPPDSRQ